MASDFHKRSINLLDNKTPDRLGLRPLESPPGPEKQKLDCQVSKIKAESKPRSRKKKLSCFFIILIVFFTIFGMILSSNNNNFLSGVKNSYLIRQIANIILPDNQGLKGEDEDRINFLFLGMGGPGHSGPYLTDTIILTSFKPSEKKAAIFSLPRDMIVPLSANNYKKINYIYALGEQQDGNGGQLAKEIIGQTLDIPIHYYASLDFNGFIEIIDAIDGIEINVERSFVDTQFPTNDFKYQEISFQAGEQTMSGLTALRFARSRHGNNNEGSDFARIKRQQKILVALKDKLTSFNTLINPQKITGLYSLFNKYTQTDLEPWEAVRLVHLGKNINTQEIITQSIDNRPGGYLKSGIATDGAFILQPVTGNFENIQMLVKNIFTLDVAIDENAKIIIQNGTKTPGLALEAVNHLNQIGHSVLRYGNANEQNKITTAIYDYTDNKPKTRESLETIFQTKAQTSIPIEYSNSSITTAWDIKNKEGNYEQLDFLIILGADQQAHYGPDLIPTIDPSLFNASTSSSTFDIINQ